MDAGKHRPAFLRILFSAGQMCNPPPTRPAAAEEFVFPNSIHRVFCFHL
jgi:hypothetical protein